MTRMVFSLKYIYINIKHSDTKYRELLMQCSDTLAISAKRILAINTLCICISRFVSNFANMVRVSLQWK